MDNNNINSIQKTTKFARALFFSWYCGLGDCTFCYMSTKGAKKQKPEECRRRFESIFAEALISKHMGWDIEFVSGGYDSYTKVELLFLVKGIYEITGQKQWLNIGTLNEKELNDFLPYTEGYAGTVETVNWDIRKKVCPSKVMNPIYKSFEFCDKLGLKKAITIIIGLGESIDDFENLKQFVIENGITRVTFYALNPHPDTPFEKSPDKEYYCEWIKKTRKTFPDVHIIAGAWVDKTDYYPAIINAGADEFTKLPSIRKFDSPQFQAIEKLFIENNIKLEGTLTKLPEVNWYNKIDELNDFTFNADMKEKIKGKLDIYLKQMRKNIKKYN